VLVEQARAQAGKAALKFPRGWQRVQRDERIEEVQSSEDALE